MDPGKAERRQPRHPRRRHPVARLAFGPSGPAVHRLLALSLRADPAAQLRVFGLALRHVAVAVRRLVRHQPRELRLPGRLVG